MNRATRCLPQRKSLLLVAKVDVGDVEKVADQSSGTGKLGQVGL